MFHETAYSVFVRERLLPCRVAVGSVGLYRVLTRITCIQPLTRSSLTFPASSFFSESRVVVFCFLFLFFFSFPPCVLSFLLAISYPLNSLID